MLNSAARKLDYSCADSAVKIKVQVVIDGWGFHLGATLDHNNVLTISDHDAERLHKFLNRLYDGKEKTKEQG
jgi:hypothetical protein